MYVMPLTLLFYLLCVMFMAAMTECLEYVHFILQNPHLIRGPSVYQSIDYIFVTRVPF